MLVKDILTEFVNSIPTPSPIAFFLGDADNETKERIKMKGYTVVEGRYDTFVFHRAHWDMVGHKKLVSLTESVEALPDDGLLEASIDHPYSHAIIPKSGAARAVIKKLFGLNESDIFKNLMNRQMTRRDFMKGVGLAAKFAKKMAPAVGMVTAAPLTSTGALAAANFMAMEVVYAATKAALYDSWEKVKHAFQEADPNMSVGEVATLDKMLKSVDLKELDLAMSIDPSLMDIANPFAAVKATPAAISLAGDLDEKLLKLRYPEWYDEMQSYKFDDEGASADDIDATSNPKGIGGLPVGSDEKEDEYDGFDDIKPKKSGEEQPWMGESRVGAVSVKHLSKAWPNKRAWLHDIDSILD